MTTERPILFSGPMVRAILDGRKTQTRRIVNRFGHIGGQRFSRVSDFGEGKKSQDDFIFRDKRGTWNEADINDILLACPHGGPGARLWVRETWQCNAATDNDIVFRATDPAWGEEMDGWRWRPAIHMPRTHSRLTLEISGIRLERLREITESDAMAEGVEPILVPPDGGSDPHVEGFRALWDTLNAKRGFGWDVNPWVWVIEFRKVD